MRCLSSAIWVLCWSAVFIPLSEAAVDITNLSVTPDPFSPESGETATFTATGTAGGTGLVVRIYPVGDGNPFASAALVESPAGTYTAAWNGKNTSGRVAWPGN